MKKKLTAGFIAGAVALAIAGANAARADDLHGTETKNEKCYGVVKAGQNDCGAADKSHSCMSQSQSDGAPNEWVALPEGVCEKLVGGSLVPVAGDTKAACDAKQGCESQDDKAHDKTHDDGKDG